MVRRWMKSDGKWALWDQRELMCYFTAKWGITIITIVHFDSRKYGREHGDGGLEARTKTRVS